MRMGTKSVLFGVHQFALHPLFVARGWFHLYGFRRQSIGLRRIRRRGVLGWAHVEASILSPRVWLAFFVHDVGYLGKPNMDGPEGELHPYLGARILSFICGEPWGDFSLRHSRFLSKQLLLMPSALCFADKLAPAMTPRWLYLLLGNLTGEIAEYMSKSAHMNETGGKYSGQNISLANQREWYDDMTAYCTRYVDHHKDGRVDEWTRRSASGAQV